MNARFAVSSCLLLLALPVAAQELETSPPDASASLNRTEGAHAPQAPDVPLDAFDTPLPQPSPARWTPAARVGTELGVGLLSAAGGGLLGGAAFGLLGTATCSSGGFFGKDFCVMEMAVLGSALGGAVGLPLGIAWGGSAAGGNGSGWAAAGGVVLGTLALTAAAYADVKPLIVPALVSIPLLGLLGYEATDTDPASLTPVVSIAPGGGSLALQGRF